MVAKAATRTTQAVSTGSGDSAAVLQELLGQTEQAVASVNARVVATTNVEQEIRQTEQALKDAVTAHEQQMAATRLRVLNTTLDELTRDAQKEQEDLATAVFGLNTFLEGLGKDYENLGQPNDDDKAELVSAQEAAEAVRAARDVLAKKRVVFFRESKLATLDTEILTATALVKSTEDEIKRRTRERLRKADITASLQEFQLRVTKAIQIMTARQKLVEEQIRIVGTRKLEAFRIKEEAAKALEVLAQRLTEKEAELRGAEEHLQTLENGTQEYTSQDQAVSKLKAETEDLRGKHNTALILHQSKERFTISLETHERTQQILRDNFRSWITLLKSDTEERVVTFKSRLSVQQSMMDQDAAAHLDKMGAEIDRRNDDFVAAAGNVSDKKRMEMAEDQPRRIQQLEATRAAQAEAIAGIRVREQAMIDYWKQRYGIDPTKSSFFHYTEGGGENPAEQPTA